VTFWSFGNHPIRHKHTYKGEMGRASANNYRDYQQDFNTSVCIDLRWFQTAARSVDEQAQDLTVSEPTVCVLVGFVDNPACTLCPINACPTLHALC